MTIHRLPVLMTDAEGNSERFDSVLDAERGTGISHTVIKNCARCGAYGDCSVCKYWRKYRMLWRPAGAEKEEG